MRTFDDIIRDIYHELNALHHKAMDLHSGYIEGCRINLERLTEELKRERKSYERKN